MKPEPGYWATDVLDFLDENGERSETSDADEFKVINDVRLNDSQRSKLKRWESAIVVPLSKLDELLVSVDLMLFEFEHWCELHDRSPWIDDVSHLTAH